MGGQALPTDEQISRADAAYQAQMAFAAKAFGGKLGSMWPCGHWRTPLTTLVIGPVAKCKTCRRKRIRDTLHKEAARRRLQAAVRARMGEKRHEEWKRKFLSEMPIGKTVIWMVAEAFRVDSDDLVSKSRVASLTRPRHMVYRLLSELTLPDGSSRFSYPMVGRLLGGRDHSTVISGKDKCHVICEREPAYAALYLTLRAELVESGFIVEAGNG